MMADEGVELKRLEVLKETVASLARVGILVNAIVGPTTQASLDAMRAASPTLGLAVQVFQVERPEEYEATFAAMTRARVQGVNVLGGRLNIDYLPRITELAVKHRHVQELDLGHNSGSAAPPADRGSWCASRWAEPGRVPGLGEGVIGV